MVGRLMMLAGVVGILAASAQASSISAAGIDYGAAGGYAIVSDGAGASITINSGPNTGNILIGQTAMVTTSGGGNGAVIGTINYDTTSFANTAAAVSAFSGLQNPPSAGQFAQVTTTFAAQAVTDANSLSDIAKALTADVGNLTTNYSGSYTFDASAAGADGVFTLDTKDFGAGPITLIGDASSVFVFNIAGNFNTNKQMVLQGNIKTTNILFNFLGTSGNVFQTAGGDKSYGVYLATKGGAFQFSNLDLTGNLINTAAHIQLVSGSGLSSPLAPAVPLPAAVWTGLALMGGLAGVGRFKRARQ